MRQLVPDFMSAMSVMPVMLETSQLEPSVNFYTPPTATRLNARLSVVSMASMASMVFIVFGMHCDF